MAISEVLVVKQAIIIYYKRLYHSIFKTIDVYKRQDSISSFLSAPVSLKTTEVYPIENYGSAMAPFYSTLSIWIGGIVLVLSLIHI